MAKPRGRPRNPRPDLGLELGLPNLNPISTWAQWSGGLVSGTLSADKISVGTDPLAPKTDELMFMIRRDGMARAMFQILTLPIRASFDAGRWIAPDGAGNAQAEVDYANNLWTLPQNAGGMRVDKDMFLQQCLLAMVNGFSCFEVVKGLRKIGPLSGKYVIDKLAYRDPRTVTLQANRNGEFNGFHQQAGYGMRTVNVDIAVDNAFLWAANEAENPLYGRSMFEAAFQSYQSKRKLYYASHLAAQLAAVPGRVGKIPLGASQREIRAFMKSLSEFHMGQSIVVPPGFELNPFNNTTGFSFKDLIQMHNREMCLSILAAFLAQDDRTILVDNGQADASADMFVTLLEAITAELARAWSNKLMPQFIDYNFNSRIYPQFRFGPLTDENKAAVLDLFKTMVGLQQINATPEFVRTNEITLAKRLGYDIDYKAVAKSEAEFAEEQQKAAQEEQQQGLDSQQPQDAGFPQSQGENNRVLQGKPSGAPTPQGGRPPNVRLSDRQRQAANNIALELSYLIEDEDIPDDFVGPEGEDE